MPFDIFICLFFAIYFLLPVIEFPCRYSVCWGRETSFSISFLHHWDSWRLTLYSPFTQKETSPSLIVQPHAMLPKSGGGVAQVKFFLPFQLHPHFFLSCFIVTLESPLGKAVTSCHRQCFSCLCESVQVNTVQIFFSIAAKRVGAAHLEDCLLIMGCTRGEDPTSHPPLGVWCWIPQLAQRHFVS